MGTIAYAAPEQLSAKFGEADWQTDIYQLGVMLYEMLTGELLFGGDLGRILSEEPATPLHLRIPEELDKVIRKAIAKRKEERYQDISAFKEQLEMMVIRALPFRSRGMLSSLE
jgi:serine/threonine protein kinase